MISTYLFVNVIGFFVQHDFHKSSSIMGVNQGSVSAGSYLMFEDPIPVTPAPPEIKIRPVRKTLPSEETINPHLP